MCNNKTRIKSGIIIVSIQWIVWLIMPALFPSTSLFGYLGGLLGGLVTYIWWAFFSKATKLERFGGLLVLVTSLVIAWFASDISIQTGMSYMMIFMYGLPLQCLVLIIWLVFSQNSTKNVRWKTLIASMLLLVGAASLLRSEGITGDGGGIFKWRWSATHEEKLLSKTIEESDNNLKNIDTQCDWPEFRGANRDGIVYNTNINSNWTSNPPKEIWRRPVGPGCSSFAVSNNHLFTQEQLGEEELVTCYNFSTGKLIWKHTDKARFWDSHAGAGPRSTPTVKDGKVYTLGATGIVNALNVENGEKIWSRNAAEDLKIELPGWGFSSSPLVVDSSVVVAIAGSLITYDIKDGKELWRGPNGGDGYSSAHLYVHNNVSQILFLSQMGLSSFSPLDGSILWERKNKGEQIIQPAIIPGGDLLINNGSRKGLSRIKVKNENNSWSFEQLWKSTRMKPDFNDIVIHKGFAFGYDGPMLTCIDLKDGNRKWRGERYGGQILLLANQDLIIVLTEKGEIALVSAITDKFLELHKFQAIDGKTWNHPILVGNILVVRNTEEMVAYNLAPAS